MSSYVKRAKKGDHDAFVCLIERHKHSLVRAGQAILKNDDDVADALQDTVLSAWQKLKDLKENKYVKTWLIRIMIFSCYRICRKNKSVLPMDRLPDEAGEAPDLETKYDVARTLEEMKENDRLLLTLYYIEDLPAKQIAALLSVSENAVFIRLSRSRDRFKTIYMKREEHSCESKTTL